VPLVIAVPPELLGRAVDLGEVVVTSAMIDAYARAVNDEQWLAQPTNEAPPTFCLTMRRGMTPEIELPAGYFGVYGGHEMEFHHPICADQTYRVTASVLEVFEKSGRSGALTVVVRQAVIRDRAGTLAVRITEQEIIRRRPEGTTR